MEFLRKLFDTSDFPQRWHCGNWSSGHGWLHIASDIAIFGAYASIPIVLAYFVSKRKDVPFPPVFWLFAAFILVCGVGHLIEATIFWRPWYRLSGVVKALTAIVSWATVIALLPVIPKALALPGLAAVNKRLETEAGERETAELQLRESLEELKEFSRNVVEREERMIELKQEVNALLQEQGREPRYLIESTDA